jgi:hypothetical protein
MSNYDLWVILGNWKTDFSTDDFAVAFPSPDPRKILYDMTKKGLLERTGRGKYKAVTGESYARSAYNIDEGYALLRMARLPYALTATDGVFAWTRGGYNANRFFGSYPIYIKILKSDLERWKTYLADNGKKFTVAGERVSETLYGIYYVLFPRDTVNSIDVGGLKVEPLEDTVEFCLREKYTFEPALEMLDKEYNLGLGVKYERPDLVT